MKWILIVVAFNMGNPSEPSMMMHKSYPSEIGCNTAAKEIVTEGSINFPNIKVMSFCVSEKDLGIIENSS